MVCLTLVGVRETDGSEEWIQDFVGRPSEERDLKHKARERLLALMDGGILASMGYQELIIRQYWYLRRGDDWDSGMIVWHDGKWLIWNTLA